KFIQHSTTYGGRVLEQLVKNPDLVPVVYAQDVDTVKRVLANWGAMALSSRLEKNMSEIEGIDWRIFKPIASQSAIWLKRTDGGCLLVLGWYVYHSLRDFQNSGNNPRSLKKKRESNLPDEIDQVDGFIKEQYCRIRGHDQPSIVILSGQPG